MNFVFDLYGTLIDIKTDEEKAAPWRALAGRLRGCRRRYAWVKDTYKELCRGEVKYEGHEIDLLRVFENMLTAEGLDKCGAPALAHEFRDASMEKLRLFPLVREMLRGLKERGAGVYLLSNAQSCFTLRELDTLGLTELFDGIVISSEVGWKKPHGEIFKIAFEKFGISPEESFYVGNDLGDDVLGAHSAGMRTVYIETEQSRYYADLKLPSPDYEAKDHQNLCSLLLDLAEKSR
jgi:putative hydrolase of the HAD superfamily